MMNVYPLLRPMVIFNAPTMYTGVWHVINKSGNYYLFYFADTENNKTISHKSEQIAPAISKLVSIVKEIGTFEHFTVYNKGTLNISDTLRLLEKLENNA